MTYSATTEPGYVLPNSWEHASERLELLEACYDAASFRRAGALGVRSGWRCLDAGAGHGSFARSRPGHGGRRGVPAARPARPAGRRRCPLTRIDSAANAANPLSRRESEVGSLIALAMSNRQIAEQLVLSERTGRCAVPLS